MIHKTILKFKVRGINPGKTPSKLTVETDGPANAVSAFRARFIQPFKQVTVQAYAEAR